MIHPLDCAREKGHTDIVNILSKVSTSSKDDPKESTTSDTLLLLRKIQEQKEKIKEIEAKNQQLEESVKKSEAKNQQLEEQVKKLKKQVIENKTKDTSKETPSTSSTSTNEKDDSNAELLKKYLFALKEKPTDCGLYDIYEYEDGKIIGEGATSSVKIVYKREREEFAKKELKELKEFRDFQRFVQEGDILFKLRHPCIIRIYGINNGDETHSPSLILSYKPNSLEKLILDKKLDNENKNRITTELVLGMRFIHRYNFMHRDLKPSNILLSKNLHVKISDFGLARHEVYESTQSKGVGTLRFMAPELFDEKSANYSFKVDVYSFGITLIFIIDDKYPEFSLKNAINGVVPEMSEKAVPWVRELISDCLSLNPENRPSFSEIFEKLKENNFDLFSESKDTNLTGAQKGMKSRIEVRVLKIEAFEYQHQESHK